jgi:hypothetical protein
MEGGIRKDIYAGIGDRVEVFIILWLYSFERSSAAPTLLIQTDWTT